jgi:hypothetical protein
MLLAEATAVTGSDWSSLGTFAVNAGFAAWIAWYLLARALPKIQSQFSADLEAQRKDLTAALERQRADNSAAIDRLEKHRADEANRLAASMDRLTTQIAALIQERANQ